MSHTYLSLKLKSVSECKQLHSLFLLFTFLLVLFFSQSCRFSGIPAKQVDSLIHGYVAPGFEEVKREFEKNFKERKDMGSACAVYYKGEKVVDLWGGWRSPFTKEPFNENTLVVVFSATKGMAAMCIAVANSRGWIDYNEKVSKYWKEFAANGKENITVRQLLAHEAGLILFDEPIYIETMNNLDSVAKIIGKQEPYWKPGTAWGYHSSTLGMYENELIRRCDPKHRTLGKFFNEEIAQPLGLNFYIGLPVAVPDSKVASKKMVTLFEGIFNIYKPPLPFVLRIINPFSRITRSFSIPMNYDPNDRMSRSVELPSGNGIGDARSMAKAYCEFAMGGKKLNLNPQTFLELCKDPVVPPDGPADQVLGVDSYYSLGYLKPSPELDFGSSRKAFGTPGAGGSFAFADPDMELGFAFITIKMDYYAKDDPRELALRNAVYKCIKKLKK
jgi:CubicO group peptidase (beta-lactamase class C family)